MMAQGRDRWAVAQKPELIQGFLWWYDYDDDGDDDEDDNNVHNNYNWHYHKY